MLSKFANKRSSSLHTPVRLIDKQSQSYNLLLTRLSKVLSRLNSKTNYHAQQSNHLDAIWCWQVVLTNLSTKVLPEFYVVFHDETTDAKQRRRLYDMTQAIFFNFDYYDQSGFLPYLSQSNEDRIYKQIITNKPLYKPYNYDSYTTGEGTNADTAYQLLEMSKYVSVNGRKYINYLLPYYNLLIAESDLRAFLLNNEVSFILRQLNEWQKKRLLAFSAPSLDTILSAPGLSQTRANHALKDWILKEYLSQNAHDGTNSRDSEVSTYQDKKNRGLVVYEGKDKAKSPNIVISAWLKFKRWITGTNTSKQQQVLLPSSSLPLKVTPRLTLKPKRRAKPLKSNKAPTSHESLQDNSRLLPLTIDEHAYHLAILLTTKPTSLLKKLIESTNILYGHIDYLKQEHPYLATSVEESIKDLTYNTLIRLDETASQFVMEGKVNPDVRNVFKQKHEARIERLISLNLSQVKNLNKIILEKKMSGFASIGSREEQNFRETIMELKILLRWLIAQQPDEMQATSFQVILEKLESSTLADMQAIYFASYTTEKQKQTLQLQLEQLLDHFKEQTNIIKLPIAAEDDKEIQALLKLTRYSESTDKIAEEDDIGSRLDNVNQQSSAKDFIDYNQHYIDQLLTHWY